MGYYTMDPLEPVDIEIRADTPAAFRFIAQKRVPGRDFRDFATSADWGRERLSRYSLELLPPVRPSTDLRFYFLMDGAANIPVLISVALSQNGKPLGAPVVCEGTIGLDDSVVFAKADVTLLVREGNPAREARLSR